MRECAAADMGVILAAKCSFTYCPDLWPKEKRDKSNFQILHEEEAGVGGRLVSPVGADLTLIVSIIQNECVES